MAEDIMDVYIKIGLDPNALPSIRGQLTALKAEATKIQLGDSLLSKDQQKLVMTRLATLKETIKDVGEATGKVKGFELLARSVGGIAGGIGAITGSMKLLGVEFKNAEKAQTILTTAMSASLAIQQLIELQNLKTAITTKAVAAAQWLWNVALDADPIIAVVTAAALLVSGIVALISIMNQGTKSSYDFVGSMDAISKASKTEKDETEKLRKELQKLSIDRDVASGKISKEAGEIAKNKLDLVDTYKAEQEQIEKNKKAYMGLGKELAIAYAARKDEYYQGSKNQAQNENRIVILEAQRKSLKKTIEEGYGQLKLQQDINAVKDETILLTDKETKTEKDKADVKDPMLERELANAKELEALKTKSDENILKHNENTTKQIIKNSKELFDLELQQIKDNTAAKIAAKQEEINKLKSFQGPETESDNAVRLAKIKELETEKVLIEDQGNSEIQASDKAYFDWLDSENQKQLDAMKVRSDAKEKKAKEDTEKQKKQTEETLQYIAIAVQAAADAVNLFLDASLEQSAQKTEEQLAQLDKAFEGETKNLDNMLKHKQISQAEYDKRMEKLEKDKAKKEKELKTEQAKKEKNAAIIKAIINTAVGVTGSLAQGGILGIIMAVITGALGALEVALIASKPIPEFKKGGLVKKYAGGGLLDGPSHSQGGIPLVAEGGEYIVNKQTMARPGMVSYMNNLNNNQTSPTTVTLNSDDLHSIVRSVVSIPVNVVETDMTRTQRKVNTIETKASW